MLHTDQCARHRERLCRHWRPPTPTNTLLYLLYPLASCLHPLVDRRHTTHTLCDPSAMHPCIVCFAQCPPTPCNAGTCVRCACAHPCRACAQSDPRLPPPSPPPASAQSVRPPQPAACHPPQPPPRRLVLVVWVAPVAGTQQAELLHTCGRSGCGHGGPGHSGVCVW